VEWFSSSDDWLSRWILERGLALTYAVAFLTTINQFRPLLGERGLMPAPRFLASVSVRRAPSVFHLRYSDRLLALTGWVGVVVAGSLLIGLPQRAPLGVALLAWPTLWILYLSVVNIGQTFYGFGWETLLLEAGFLALFLGNSETQPPVLIMWLVRWLLFRLELGAGLIKMRGDPCWRDLSCLDFHHETQPMPNPLSRWAHRRPRLWHRVEVLANHGAQLVVPWFLFAPEPVATGAALIVVVTQAWLVVTGNFSWLNILTIVLALSVVDGSLLAGVLTVDPPDPLRSAPLWHDGMVVPVTAGVLVLSFWPVRNMLSRRQRMNTSFNPLRLVNSYGAFGSVTRVRREIVVEGTADRSLDPESVWMPYEFKGKPGDVCRRPRQVAPYHLRLDWLMWFAALSPQRGRGWFRPLVGKLLEGDAATLRLLARNPFPDEPPTFVRARLYRYRYSTRDERRSTGAWWSRTLEGEYLSPVRLRARQPRT